METYNRFRTSELDKVKNSISQSIEEIFEQFIQKNFNCLYFDNLTEVDIDKIYDNNYKLCINELNADIDDFGYFIENNQDLKSMLYFRIPDDLYERYNNYIINESNKKSDETNTERKDIQTSTKNTQLISRNNNNYNYNDNKIKSEYSQKHYDIKSENNEKTGKTAEEIAYNGLKKDFPNIIWHSKNSKIPSDRNKAPVGVTCDMWNIDSSGKKTYFEIKSSINEFTMSINEYNSMKTFKDDYEVVLVDVKTQTITRHKFSELDPLKQVSQYAFYFEQVEKDD